MVCYADILGFHEMTERAFESGNEEAFLRRGESSLDAAYEEIHEDTTTRDSRDSILDMKILDMKLFTDNIVVGYPLHDPIANFGEPELGALLILFAHAQARLAADGFFIWGRDYHRSALPR